MHSDHQRLDETLAQIWQTAFDVPRVNPDDDFFDLGGNSRLAIDIIFRIRDLLDIEIPVAILNEASRFNDFTRAVGEAVRASKNDGRQ